jgi:hypothetical protein
MNEQLFLAILALDSYNQGPRSSDPNLNDVGSKIGTAETNIRLSDNTGWLATGFFAQSYSWNGKTVISYRGTDSFPNDLLTGWVLATGLLGFPEYSQAQLAFQFFESVTQRSILDVSDRVDP